MYFLNEKTVTNEDGETALSYGITYEGNAIYDVCTEKEKVQDLVDLCNKEGLEPCHINDVIDDFLVGFRGWLF